MPTETLTVYGVGDSGAHFAFSRGAVIWGSPVKGRGLERPILESLLEKRSEGAGVCRLRHRRARTLAWLAEQNVEVIVADHHRLSADRPPALAWIHPEVQTEPSGEETPAGCVMAFKLAQALWTSYLGENDAERLDYFLFDHLDLVCLGILADRMPLTGENRTLVWHGLRRLSHSRKVGLNCLTRFFR